MLQKTYRLPAVAAGIALVLILRAVPAQAAENSPLAVVELSFGAQETYADPYNQLEVDVTFQNGAGASWRVPAFWAGGNDWKVRFSAPPGDYSYESSASNPDDAGLHGVTGEVSVPRYSGTNPLGVHGRVRAAEDRRHFEHEDGTPFFWLADTWWMGLTTRLDWPAGFQQLASDRIQKGFNVIQIVCGPYPDMDAGDSRGRNEAGFPFTDDFSGVNPAYFDHADHKIVYLAESGLMPCIVGMWGYYLPRLGVDNVKRYWRYLVARYGAYPVTWCIAGEATMPYYLSEARDAEQTMQKQGWTEVMAYVREIDPFHNMISIHPTHYGREQVNDPCLMDFEMLQAGHSDLDSVSNVIRSVRKAWETELAMPVVNSEVNYEGILGRAWQNVQRLCFYHTVMNGAAGHTYGANGIWQLNEPDAPYGPSPHGRSWGNTPWQEAAALPGSHQVGLGAKFWRRFPWWELQRHDEWLKKPAKDESAYGTIAIGIPGRLRIVYAPMCWDAPGITGLEAGVQYRAWYFDPVSGTEVPLGEASGDAEGSWTPPLPPEVHDWVLVMEAA